MQELQQTNTTQEIPQREFYCNVYIVDERMGKGKTSAAMNFMLNAPDDQKFLYITPYTEEFLELKPRLKPKKFKEPKYINNRKLNGLKELISKNSNIISTHALFHRFDRELIETCRAKGYTLIMDEVTDVITKYEISEDDFDLLLDKFVTIDERTGILHWRPDQDDYNGRFANEKRLCDLHSLALYGGTVMMWLFPIEVFNAFKDIYILTYMFPAQMQRYYYDFYNLPYKYLYVTGDSRDTYKFTTNTTERNNITPNYKALIDILYDEKLNRIGMARTDLSKSWYDRHKHDEKLFDEFRKHTYNFFYNKCQTPSSQNLWTTFKEYKEDLSGKGYSKGFESVNMRATNKHRERTSVAYLVNRFIDPNIKNFFSNHDIKMTRQDEDAFALSEMLQFIWRSAIRENNPIRVYIPSSRMRKLLEDWIDEQMRFYDNTTQPLKTLTESNENKTYIHTGWFYFGQASIPFHVVENVYQVKCLLRQSENSKNFETVYLQFETNDKITLDFLEKLQHSYMQKASGRYQHTNKEDVLLIHTLNEPKLVRQSKYQTETYNNIFDRLSKMAIQKKPK